jgi:cbb3-type cytochrome oxidase subunit 3
MTKIRKIFGAAFIFLLIVPIPPAFSEDGPRRKLFLKTGEIVQCDRVWMLTKDTVRCRRGGEVILYSTDKIDIEKTFGKSAVRALARQKKEREERKEKEEGDSLLIVGLLAAAVFFILLIWYTLKQSKRNIIDAAEKTGLSQSQEDPLLLMESLEKYQLFSPDRLGRSISHILEGMMDDTEVKLIDYHYKPKYQRSPSPPDEYVVAVFRSNKLDLPYFFLRPENIVDKVKSRFGSQDIDFSVFPKFSSMYLLKSEDEYRIRSLFRPEVIFFYEENKGLRTEGHGDQLIIYKDKGIHSGEAWIPIKRLSAFWEQALAVLSLFKAG